MALVSKLKKGDLVIVNSGKHKGATGKILKMITKNARCIVEGVALVKKHKKATSAEEKSQIISVESSVNLSNLSYYDEKLKKGVKLGYKTEDGKKVRYNKKTSEIID